MKITSPVYEFHTMPVMKVGPLPPSPPQPHIELLPPQPRRVGIQMGGPEYVSSLTVDNNKYVRAEGDCAVGVGPNLEYPVNNTTLPRCAEICNVDPNCAGFSAPVPMVQNPSSRGTCFLKKRGCQPPRDPHKPWYFFTKTP